MEHVNRGYPKVYAPIPKGIIKEEPEDREEIGDQSESLMAYKPLPPGVVKEEPQMEDGFQVENKVITDEETTGHREYPDYYPPIAKCIVKEEPASDGDDSDDGCELVAYSPLPNGVIKEESEVGDDRNEFISGVQIRQQEGNQNIANEVTEDTAAVTVVPSVHTPALGNWNETEKQQTNKRKRSRKGHRSFETMPSSSRSLRNGSKGSSSKKNSDGAVKHWEVDELTMEECDDGAKTQQNCDQYDERSEHSSLDGVISTDEEDLVLNQPLAEHTQRNREKENLPFKCKNCDRVFKVERYLKKHLARSCGIEPRFACKECGNHFTRKSSLQQHLMSMHNVEKSQLALFGAGPNIRPVYPFKCGKCSRSYKQKSSLTKHLKYECELEPSFPCTLCNYRASLKGSLQAHLMAVHSVGRSQFTAFGTAAPKIRPVQPFKC